MLEIDRIKTYSIKKRKSKVAIKSFAKVSRGRTFDEFYRSLPDILAARNLKCVVTEIVKAHKKKKTILFMLGAHVIKCGLSPLIIDLIKRKVISAVALNGAGIIHDFEIAYTGCTSEDVAGSLKNGSFGMARETAGFLNTAINDGVIYNYGIGEAVGKAIEKKKPSYKELSIIYNCSKQNIPVTVHVAIGTDIIHQHPNFDGGLTGAASQKDFYTLADVVSGLENGVVVNFGSAVVLPEVFLKALNMARNLRYKVNKFTTANFDMIHHYRPQQNVVSRPTASGGKGHYIVGHHEIMLPLLHKAIVSQL